MYAVCARILQPRVYGEKKGEKRSASSSPGGTVEDRRTEVSSVLSLLATSYTKFIYNNDRFTASRAVRLLRRTFAITSDESKCNILPNGSETSSADNKGAGEEDGGRDGRDRGEATSHLGALS